MLGSLANQPNLMGELRAQRETLSQKDEEDGLERWLSG